jgi:hypothetical protein
LRKVDEVVLKKVGVGLGVTIIAMALSLGPAVAASGNVKASTTLRANALCTAYKADIKAGSKPLSPSVTKAINSQNWAVAQKALLSVFNGESGLLKSVVSALQGAPSNVKSAAGVVVTFEGTLKNLISNSKSKAKYQSAVTAASNSPKLASAEKVLDAYTQKACPGVITTPTT